MIKLTQEELSHLLIIVHDSALDEENPALPAVLALEAKLYAVFKDYYPEAVPNYEYMLATIYGTEEEAAAIYEKYKSDMEMGFGIKFPKK